MKDKTFQRRFFLKLAASGLLVMAVNPRDILAEQNSEGLIIEENDNEVIFSSRWIKVSFPFNRPGLSYLAIDSSGLGRLSKNLLMLPQGGDLVAQGPFPPKASEVSFKVSRHGHTVKYDNIRLGEFETVQLVFTIDPQHLNVAIKRSIAQDYPTMEASPFRLLFDPSITPPGLMARLKARGQLQFPVLVHFPDHGSLLVRAKGADYWKFSYGPRYQKQLGKEGIFEWIDEKFRNAPKEVQLSLIQGWHPENGGIQKAGGQNIEMELAVTAIYPEKAIIDADPKLEGIKRAWLNIFQFRPDIALLSNNVVSDNCGFCLYEYADQAYFTPPLFDDFLALDLIRISLETYFGGAKSYAELFLDVDPSIIIATWDYVDGTRNLEWLKQNWEGVGKYAKHMMAADLDGDGMPESQSTGNSGTGKDGYGPSPSNWYDTISFGWKDAYSTALHYRAFCCLEDLERRMGNLENAQIYRQRSAMIKKLYYQTFYNPMTGVLAGWRSKDGVLHDYYFMYVNGIAISYGLIPEQNANQIMDRMQAKLKEVGYSKFRIGLPGNLISVEPKDMCGWPYYVNPGEDFQVYCNGGASGNHAFHYLQALYHLGRRQEADLIFEGMLEGYRDGVFQGGVNMAGHGQGKDWKRWDGSPCGYEGYLTDNYYALTCLMTGKLKRGIPFPENHT